MNPLPAPGFVRRAIRRTRFGRTLADLVARQRLWQYRVDCRHPHDWYSPFSFFFDKRVSASRHMVKLREKGWEVSVHGERWT